MLRIYSILFSILFYLPVNAQMFYFGNDLSYANEMEDCGAIFKENMQPKDVYNIFADHGTNLVRVRLWNNPSWQNSLAQPEGVKNQYSDYDDVYETIQRVKSTGMQALLDLQLSDMWADPGRQVIPNNWLDVANDVEILKDSVYNFVIKVLTGLNNEGLLPEIIKIGNENNGGILMHTGIDANWNPTGTVSTSWARHAKLYNSAIKAIRDFSDTTSLKPKILLHCSDIKNVTWWYQNIIGYGVTDFDIIGFSYYYSWHGASISALGSKIRSLRTTYPQYEVMVAETGYLWSTENFDNLVNIVTTPDPNYLPVSPEKQLEYMVDFTREVIRSGGCGVVFWEPAWVSTPCRTPWGIGSSQEHIAFFDPINTNFMVNGGGRWTEPEFYETSNSLKCTFKVDLSNIENYNKAYISGSFLSDSEKYKPMLSLGNKQFSYVTYLPESDSGTYYFLYDSLNSSRETIPTECVAPDLLNRAYKVLLKDTTFAFSFSSCSPITPQTLINAEKSNRLYIFPNPTSGKLSINSNTPLFAKTAGIYTITGSKIADVILNNNSIDLTELTENIYILKIVTENNIYQTKVLLKK